MKQFIADEKVILSLQGLRWIMKTNQAAWGNSPEKYGLEWNYKGSENKIGYEKEEDRDAMYVKVRDALTKETSK